MGKVRWTEPSRRLETGNRRKGDADADPSFI